MFYVFIHRFPGRLGWSQQYEKQSSRSSEKTSTLLKIGIFSETSTIRKEVLTGSIILSLYITSKPPPRQKLLCTHLPSRPQDPLCQSPLVMPTSPPLQMNFSMNSCLNKQIHLATLVWLGKNANRSIFNSTAKPKDGIRNCFHWLPQLAEMRRRSYTQGASKCLHMARMPQEAVSSTWFVG